MKKKTTSQQIENARKAAKELVETIKQELVADVARVLSFMRTEKKCECKCKKGKNASIQNKQSKSQKTR